MLRVGWVSVDDNHYLIIHCRQIHHLNHYFQAHTHSDRCLAAMVIILHKTQPNQSNLSQKCWELWQEVLVYHFLWLLKNYLWMTSRGICLKIHLLGPHYTAASSATTSHEPPRTIVWRRVESVKGNRCRFLFVLIDALWRSLMIY